MQLPQGDPQYHDDLRLAQQREHTHRQAQKMDRYADMVLTGGWEESTWRRRYHTDKTGDSSRVRHRAWIITGSGHLRPR